jgi:NADPH:quinone reductase-like Zn-dependent oxidoreductase
MYPAGMSSALIPGKMKAVLWKGYGGYDQLEFREDVPVPRPEPGWVLVRIGAASVNNTEIKTRTGWYSRSVSEGTSTHGAAQGFSGAADSGWTGVQQQFPRIQGADGCGRIAAVGGGVCSSRIGERVLIEPIIRPSGQPGTRVIYFGSECDGAFAEYACVPSVNAHAIQSGFSDAELASFPCAYAAAEHMLHRAEVQAGEDLLITGASGGVGSAAVQLAVRRGARVIAVAAQRKAAAIAALGAARVLDRDADLGELLGGESIDVVIDVVGGGQFGQLLTVLKRRGRYAAAGAIAGPIVELDLRTLYLKDLQLHGCTVFEPVVFRNLIGYIETAEIRPLVAKQYPLSAIVAAQQEFTTKDHVGKVVLLP